MSQQKYLITFENVSPADVDFYAEDLSVYLRRAISDISIERQRDNSRAQDFGTTLVLVFGTPAAVAVATALRDWITRYSTANLTLKTADEEIVLQNITNKDAAELIRIFLSQQSSQSSPQSSSNEE